MRGWRGFILEAFAVDEGNQRRELGIFSGAAGSDDLDEVSSHVDIFVSHLSFRLAEVSSATC